jgi:small subunit ribosomal protein S8
MTDPIADLLTRLRNASAVGLAEIRVPHSKLKQQLAEVLKREGFVRSVATDRTATFPHLVIALKYSDAKTKEPAIRGLTRISKPGQRMYVAKQRIPRVQQGLGLAIISTPAGLLTDREARKKGMGGEVMCLVW